MPATCFNCLPRGAGAIAQRCRLSLQGLSETCSPRRASQRFAATCMHWWAKMRYQAHAYGCWRRRVAPRRLARASAVKTLASWADKPWLYGW